MRAAAAAVLVLLAACHPQPRRVHEKTLPVRVELETGTWLDRDAGVYGILLVCYEPRAETWCEHGCETRIERTPVPCPNEPVSATSATGAVATALPTADGAARLEFGAPVAGELASLTIGGRALRAPSPEASRFAPPSTVDSNPLPTFRRKSYVIPMVLGDLGVILASYLAGMVLQETRSDALKESVGALVFVGYLGVGAGIHYHYGNKTQATYSPFRRLGLPVLGGILGAVAFHHDCSDGDEFCGLDEAIGAMLGVMVGGITAIIYDAARANVAVRVSPLGVSGTF